MEITQISLKNFRNHKNTTVQFSSGLNVVCGKNAQGKTNLVEAIYFCVVGKSFRAKREKEVICMGEESAKISIEIKKKIAKMGVDVLISKGQNKSVKINGIAIKKIGELLGEFNGVFFAPDELKLIKESPEDRRRFMDIDISQTSREYFYLLSKYDKVLKQRNKMLKSGQSVATIKDSIFVWDTQLATFAEKIKLFRQNFVLSLAPYAKLAHSYLTDGAEDLQIEYATIQQNSKQEILQKLEENLQKDLALGYTSFGVHRDDIKVCINDVDIRTFGSQGQQRTAALSLKLAEVEIIKNNTNTYPVLILDDVLSELDQKRREKLLNFSKKTQTILTCTEFDYNIDCNKITIDGGSVV